MEQVKAGDESRRLGSKRRHHRHRDDDKDRDYVFEGIFFSIPTTCLFVVMDILVHRQFGEDYGASNIFHKVIKVFPGTKAFASSYCSRGCLGHSWSP